MDKSIEGDGLVRAAVAEFSDRLEDIQRELKALVTEKVRPHDPRILRTTQNFFGVLDGIASQFGITVAIDDDGKFCHPPRWVHLDGQPVEGGVL